MATKITASTKYYIAVDVLDKTGRTDGSVTGLVRKGMKKAASKLAPFVVAPAGESKSQAEKVLAAHSGLKAFLLSTKVKEPSYAGGNLKIRLEVAIFTYPGRALKGSFSVGLTQQGATSGDTASENELILMAAERAMEKFAPNAGRIN